MVRKKGLNLGNNFLVFPLLFTINLNGTLKIQDMLF